MYLKHFYCAKTFVLAGQNENYGSNKKYNVGVRCLYLLYNLNSCLPFKYGILLPTYHCINPLLPIEHKSARIDKISILKLEEIIKKISYERRDYESVDEKSLSKAMSRKTTKKRIQACTKGLVIIYKRK